MMPNNIINLNELISDILLDNLDFQNWNHFSEAPTELTHWPLGDFNLILDR